MATKAKPTDVTGRQREALIESNAEAQAEAANRMSMATAEALNKLETEEIDATKPGRQTVIVDESTVVGGAEATMSIRCIETVENMTLGAGNNYNFKAGQKYTVTEHVGTHIIMKGYAVKA